MARWSRGRRWTWIASKDAAALDTEIKVLLADTVAKMEIMKTRGDHREV